MNKLVIIGNGFDLAHGLPTTYKNFIDNFWQNLEIKKKDSLVNQIVQLNEAYDGYFNYGGKKITCYADLVNNVKLYANEYRFNCINGIHGLIVEDSKNRMNIFRFTNDFFRVITLESIENWVDIENIYYEILKDLVNNKNNTHSYQHKIERLNQEFEIIKTLLSNYLHEEINCKYNFKDSPLEDELILDLFKIKTRHLQHEIDNDILLEFQPEDHKDLFEFDAKLVSLANSKNYTFDVKKIDWPHSLFLDFNYTKTAQNYVNQINSNNEERYGTASLIKIHGEIQSKDNQINFGFGDEMDDDYKLIEKTGNNQYLKNIKSFQYLHTSNYRKLLNWIETDKFQVYIFGHSCGLSDRTLLNTIFENNNCRSIKIFFHKKDGSTNYTELTNNISRYFDDKALMRSKLVDKTLCIELPQKMRFKPI